VHILRLVSELTLEMFPQLEKVNHLTGESAGSLMENARLAQKNRSDLNDLDSLFKVLAQDVHM